jgi:CRISPR-associated protein Csm3
MSSGTIELTFIGNLIIRGKLNCLTGLHIGGSKDKMQIGGVDNPVMRDPQTHLPYIPGSSLKGKLRSLSEFAQNKTYSPRLGRHECGEKDCTVCKLFGSPEENRDRGPTRIIIRDCLPDNPTKDLWEKLDSDLLYTELKPENNIDRITSEATPRQLERIVRGSCFDVEIIISLYKKEDTNLIPVIIEALNLLEANYLGGSGTRGYGQVAFRFTVPVFFKREDYQVGLKGVKDKLQDISTIKWEDLALSINDLQDKINSEFSSKPN